MNNKDLFRTTLEKHYVDLFVSNPEYDYTSKRIDPAALAEKMTNGLVSGSANKDGDGIKRTCKELGIKHTYTDIRKFLSE